MNTLSLKDVTVVIPAFNEAAGIQNTLKTLVAGAPGVKIIVIDDGSTDDTFELASQVSGVHVVQHMRNHGYGAALKTGMRLVETPVVVWYDSDGQHRPEDLLKIVEPLLHGKLDANLGHRDRDSAFVAKRVPGKALLRIVSQLVCRKKIPDLNCGLRAFRTEVILAYLHLLPDGFSASATSTLLMIKRGYRYAFSNVCIDKRVGKSTVKMVRDGARSLMLILRIMILFDAFLFFLILSLFQILPGFAYSIYLAVAAGLGFPVLGAVIIMSGILTFFLGVVSSQISEMRLERLENLSRIKTY